MFPNEIIEMWQAIRDLDIHLLEHLYENISDLAKDANDESIQEILWHLATAIHNECEDTELAVDILKNLPHDDIFKMIRIVDKESFENIAQWRLRQLKDSNEKD